MIEKVSVIGAGSLGTAIAQLVSNNVEEVFLHAKRKQVVENILKTGRNLEYYPNTLLSPKIKPEYKYGSEIDSDIVFLCVPSSAVRQVSSEINELINEKTILVSTAKGMEYPSAKTMAEVIFEETGKKPVVFSGPNFASEIFFNMPTVTNIASKDFSSTKQVKNVLNTKEFLVDIVDDPLGTEMCSILKNINAIAYGICEGMNINNNAKFALLTKGFNEIKEIVDVVGGDSKTVDTYCGFGDIVLTATSNQSRNHTLGVLHGQRIIIDETSSSILFEGKKAVMAIYKICENEGIDSIVIEFVYNVLTYQKSPKIAFRDIWEKMSK